MGSFAAGDWRYGGLVLAWSVRIRAIFVVLLQLEMRRR